MDQRIEHHELQDALKNFNSRHGAGTGNQGDANESLRAALRAAYAAGVSEYALMMQTQLSQDTIRAWLAQDSD